ncbi:MAG: hypothetical protein JSV67_03480 [Thermoplasmatales archaeon]|nr:MAG: hypothetical protein JSV67_03480 [Thermoplasmatales archaeon]
MKKIILIIFIGILLCNGLNVFAYQEKTNDNICINFVDKEFIINDVLIMPTPFQSSLSLPNYYETSEYLIGSVSVGVLLLESNGLIDDSLEDWTLSEENLVTSEIQDSMIWWEEQNPNADVTFHFDWNYDVTVSYEPIIHPSAVTNDHYQQLWVSEALKNIGYDNGDWAERAYSYVNDLRNDMDTDWSYAIFVIDSSEDSDGAFTDGYFAYSYLGGPFLIMTYDNQRFGIDMMNQVLAHEMGHTFWATDEYNGMLQYSGYLNAPDNDGSGCVMDTADLCVSSGTALQIGWRDTDSDSILDIVDTYPDTTLYISNNLPNSSILDFYGVASIQPYPNHNPFRADNDISINIITNIQYRINNGDWINLQPKDGEYDNHTEDFNFKTNPLPKGLYKIEARSTNSIGNSDLTPSIINITIDINNSQPIKPIKPSGVMQGKTSTEYEYSTHSIDPNGDDLYYLFDWGDNTNSGWIGPFDSGQDCFASKIWIEKGTYNIRVKAKDIYDLESEWSDSLSVIMPKSKEIQNSLIQYLLQRIGTNLPLIKKILNEGIQ